MAKQNVRASDIGACGFCPYQHYLRKNLGDSKEVKQRLVAGERSHDRFNKRHRTGGLLLPVVGLLVLVIVWLILRAQF